MLIFIIIVNYAAFNAPCVCHKDDESQAQNKIARRT